MLEKLINILSYSLPFRDNYFPTVYTPLIYLIPILLGFITYKLSKKLENSLIISLILSTPILILGLLQINSFNTLILFYYFLIFILLGYLGGFFSYLIYDSKIEITKKNNSKQEGGNIEKNKGFFIASCLLIILFSIINLIPVINSDYPVGADVYFHGAASKNIFGEFSDTHPYFKESSISPYRAEGYSVIKLFNIVSGINLENIWRFLPSAGILIFLFSLFSLIRKNFGDKISFFSILFIGPLNQFLFNDPSLRLLAYSLFIVILNLFSGNIQKRKLTNLFAILILCFALFFYHLEIFVQTILVMVFYLILSKITISKKAYSLNNLKILKIFFILVLASVLMIGKLISFKDISSLMIYNEIVFSLIYPVGIISFIVGIFFISALIQKEKINTKEIIFIAITLLSLNSILYFTLFWKLHHRYFIETAYIGFSIFAAQYLVKSIPNLKKQFKIILVVALIALLFLSIYPRMEYSLEYSNNVDGLMDKKLKILNELSDISKKSPGGVILIHPEDYLNRYIPLYTNFFVFTGLTNENITILPFCGKFGLMNDTCREREELGYSLIKDINKNNLEKINLKYDIDYLLIQKEENLNIANLEIFKKIYEDETYILYEVVNEN
jgi:hypothetical protein